MEPAYGDGGFNFCWTLRYRLSPLQRHDVVAVRMAGRRAMYLKRVVAFAGETVAFVDGRLVVDGRPIPEPYVKGPCNWNLPPRRVDAGCVYVVGDNRSIPMEMHEFGQTEQSRVIGGPLW